MARQRKKKMAAGVAYAENPKNAQSVMGSVTAEADASAKQEVEKIKSQSEVAKPSDAAQGNAGVVEPSANATPQPQPIFKPQESNSESGVAATTVEQARQNDVTAQVDIDADEYDPQTGSLVSTVAEHKTITDADEADDELNVFNGDAEGLPLKYGSASADVVANKATELQSKAEQAGEDATASTEAKRIRTTSRYIDASNLIKGQSLTPEELQKLKETVNTEIANNGGVADDNLLAIQLVLADYESGAFTKGDSQANGNNAESTNNNELNNSGGSDLSGGNKESNKNTQISPALERASRGLLSAPDFTMPSLLGDVTPDATAKDNNIGNAEYNTKNQDSDNQNKEANGKTLTADEAINYGILFDGGVGNVGDLIKNEGWVSDGNGGVEPQRLSIPQMTAADFEREAYLLSEKEYKSQIDKLRAQYGIELPKDSTGEKNVFKSQLDTIEKLREADKVLKEYNDPNRDKRVRATKVVAMIADAIAAAGNILTTSKGGVAHNLSSATEKVQKQESANDAALQKRIDYWTKRMNEAATNDYRAQRLLGNSSSALKLSDITKEAFKQVNTAFTERNKNLKSYVDRLYKDYNSALELLKEWNKIPDLWKVDRKKAQEALQQLEKNIAARIQVANINGQYGIQREHTRGGYTLQAAKVRSNSGGAVPNGQVFITK